MLNNATVVFLYEYEGVLVHTQELLIICSSFFFKFLSIAKKDHVAKGIDQKNPPAAPIATTVARVIGSKFGIPKIGPSKGSIDVTHPTGIRILRLTSGQLALFDN